MFEQVKDASLSSVSQLLAVFYSLPVVGGSYGLAIIMLTAAVMIVLMPLTIKATRSTIKMTQLQPQLRELQKKHKEDKTTLNQEMMALYSENGVNPVGGCLPMLAQLPVFLILFNVLRGLARRVSEKAYYAVADEAHQMAGGTTTDGQTFDPEYLDHSTQLYQDLSQDTTMTFGPFDLARDAWEVVQNDLLAAIPYVLLIAFVVGSSYYQQRQVSARRSPGSDSPTPQQQTQQQLLRILPLMSGVWSFIFPAGLVLYWATSNLFRIGQQAYITRALYQGSDAETDTSSGGPLGTGDDSDPTETRKSAKSKNAGATLTGVGEDRSNGETKAERRARNRERFRSTEQRNGAANATGEAGDTGDAGVNGEYPDTDSETAGGREEAWARRRAERAGRTKQKKSTADNSNRTTPKGTKPSSSKKKRKR